jgi:hypothetical protein
MKVVTLILLVAIFCCTTKAQQNINKGNLMPDTALKISIERWKDQKLVDAQRSSIYNNKGYLRSDTTLRISHEQLNKWKLIEYRLLQHLIENIKYPILLIENGIWKEHLIISFAIDSSGTVISIKKIVGLTGGIEDSVQKSLNNFQEIKILMSSVHKTETYYLPIDLEFIDTKTYLDKENSLPIIKIR